MKLEIKGNDIKQFFEILISTFTIFLGIIMLCSVAQYADNLMTKLIIAYLVIMPIEMCGWFLLLRVLKESYYEEFKKELGAKKK